MRHINLIVSALALLLFAGCMTMEEMLASSDPRIHAYGEEMAVDYVIDRQRLHTLQEKQAILKEITDEMNLAEVYISERADPEIRKLAQAGVKSEDAYAYVFMMAKDDKIKQDAAQHITSDEKRIETTISLAELYGTKRQTDIESMLKTVKDVRRIGKILGAHSEKAIRKFESSHRYGEDYDDYKRAEQVWKCVSPYITTEQALEEIQKCELVDERWGHKVSELSCAIDKLEKAKEETEANVKRDQVIVRVKKLYGEADGNIASFYKRAFGTENIAVEQKKFVGSCTGWGVMIGMPFSLVVNALGDSCKPMEKWEIQKVEGGDTCIPTSSFNGRFREVYTKYPSGQTDLEIYAKDDVVIGLSSLPQGIKPTYEYKLASEGSKKVWCCGEMIAVWRSKSYWPTEGTHNFFGVDKRLPSSFFAIEELRLGMTERETQFITDFVWEFREETSNPYAKLPKYEETEVGKLFPNITVAWGQSDQDAYRADGIWPVAIEHYFGVAYEITRHYFKSECKNIGGFEGLKQRLCQKLGCNPTKTSPKFSLSELDRPLVKSSKFDKRFDPWVVWTIPEKDLMVELREIHDYEDVNKAHGIRCDLIIRSLSLLKAKEEGTKAAQTSATAGF